MQYQRSALKWVFPTLDLDTLGSSAYAMKFPERWFRRGFDVFGASYKCMYICVVGAGMFQCGSFEKL
ncbi:hypothetical protein BJ875DRAFT_474716 [Amylocarpus encephaloides]|uniref:Uncharacterized protein n=1 Tax=Amylocarpus encephaloides TaxID=45428 RepID=A0A9P8C0K1_9HELO|nr:hypothetical protein BJ875DRAFT_474716 [Amylocarpus encephaloides]